MGSVMQTTREATISTVALLGVMPHSITVIIPGKCQCLMNVVVVPIQTVQFSSSLSLSLTCGKWDSPGGTSEECPAGTYCFADVPCTVGATPPPGKIGCDKVESIECCIDNAMTDKRVPIHAFLLHYSTTR